MRKSMKHLRILMALFVIAIFAGFVFAGGEKGEEALQKLMDGNKRFVSGNLSQKDLSDAKRKELAKGQKPFAIVVTCSDSRVSPELLFDQGLGEIFVIRVAGNVIDPIAIGSIEYAAEHLHAPLLIVLGHEKCGAVAATLEAKGKPEGNIGAIVKKITPAAKKAKEKGGTEDEILQTAIKENVKNTCREIVKKSKIIYHLVHNGELKIVAGEYSLTTGNVELIELPHPPIRKSGREAHGKT
ncbi:MAG: carbonic anhydrase [Nitrospirae bacterium]|nr:carbonic anhydrase [Nitrospirota bacterium]